MDARFAFEGLSIQVTRKHKRARQRFIVLGPMPPGGYCPLLAAGDLTYDGRIVLDHGAMDADALRRLEPELQRVFSK